MFNVPLIAIKSGAGLGSLRYDLVPIRKIQPRLTGRVALEPLGLLWGFHCQAVIDWVNVRIFVGKMTQHQWIQEVVEKVIGRTCHIHVIDKGAGDASDKFEIKVQEPDLRQVQRLCDALDVKFDLQIFPVVCAMEVSVDFRSRFLDARDRAKLLMVLSRHFWPKQDVLTNYRDRPRFFPDSRFGGTSGVLGRKDGRPDLDDHYLVSVESDRRPFIDATHYVGAEEADVRWRIMDKVIDSQNRSAGTLLNLSESEKRVRIEVTLDRPAVAGLGVDYLDDLKNLRFSRLQSKFFRFALPTFQDVRGLAPGVTAAAHTWRERHRMMKFMNAGAIGLAAMDDALERQMKTLRLKVRGDLRRKGLTVKPIPRVGSGSAGTFVAYAELNERVAVALRHLEERVAASFSRS